MARISFSALVDEIVGKLAGSVFQDSYFGMQVRTRVTPRNPRTQYQQLRRGEFGFLSASWRNLTNVERQTFIDAASTPPEALNLFLQANVNLTLINEPTITTYVASSDPGSMAVEFYSVTEEEMQIRATGAVTTVPTGKKLLIQITAMKPPTRIFTNPSSYSPVISFDEGTDLSIPTDILSEWQSRYGVLLPDKRLCLKASLIDKSNGLRGADVINCTNSEEMPKFVKIFTDVNTVSQAGAGSTDAYTFSMPANTLAQDGDCLTIVFQGTSSGGGAGKTADFFIGATSNVNFTAQADGAWTLYIHVQRIASDTIRISGIGIGLLASAQYNSNNASPYDFTAAIDLILQLNVPTSGTISVLSASINKEVI